MTDSKNIGRIAGLDILAAGRKTQTVKSRLKHWRTLNAYALVYICEGHGTFESNETAEIPVKAGDCFFLFPGVSHFYKPAAGTVWKEIWVLFRGATADHMEKEKALESTSPVIRMHETRRDGFQTSLENLADFYKVKAGEYRIHCTSLLYSCLLLAVMPMESLSFRSQDKLLLDEMRQILYRHIGSSRKIPDFFHTSDYSYHTLRTDFVRLAGQSPGKYLNELRMQRAEEQLLWSGLSIAEICRTLGFSDSRYFSKAFKKHAGISPGEFRLRYHLIR